MDQDTEHKVTFGEEEFRRPVLNRTSHTSPMTGWVIKYSGGVVKDGKQASYVLVAFVAITVIVLLFLILDDKGTVGHPKDIQILPAES